MQLAPLYPKPKRRAFTRVDYWRNKLTDIEVAPFNTTTECNIYLIILSYNKIILRDDKFRSCDLLVMSQTRFLRRRYINLLNVL